MEKKKETSSVAGLYMEENVVCCFMGREKWMNSWENLSSTWQMNMCSLSCRWSKKKRDGGVLIPKMANYSFKATSASPSDGWKKLTHSPRVSGSREARTELLFNWSFTPPEIPIYLFIFPVFGPLGRSASAHLDVL